MSTQKQNGFASSLGFVLASAGSAVGLGNIWGFPYKTGANGGAAFVIVYILMALSAWWQRCTSVAAHRQTP